jgi:hypothetical protein
VIVNETLAGDVARRCGVGRIPMNDQQTLSVSKDAQFRNAESAVAISHLPYWQNNQYQIDSTITARVW